MFKFIAALAVSSTFTLYPGFVEPKSEIQVVRDLGPVLEIVVRCPAGSGIMSYSKLDKKYCTPDWSCHGSMELAIQNLCK